MGCYTRKTAHQVFVLLLRVFAGCFVWLAILLSTAAFLGCGFAMLLQWPGSAWARVDPVRVV